MSEPHDVVIVRALRTPIGKYGGALRHVRPDDLSSTVLAALVRGIGIDAGSVDDVIWGCANQAGEDNRNVARMALLLAGFPHSVPGVTVNRLCGSSLEAIVQAARAIRCGDASVVIAGGVESMSRAPYALPKQNSGSFGNVVAYDTALGWRFPNPRMSELFPLESMGETAENIAQEYSISREEQDRFALESHRRAVSAQESGAFEAEVIPVDAPHGKKGTVSLSSDEGPRRDTSLEKLAGLKPVFREGGTVTAGNSSGLNDGASGVLLMSAAKARSVGIQPLARIRSSGIAGVDPRFMGLGPIPASNAALQKAGLGVGDMDVIELNEAFASQAIAVMRDLRLRPERTNPNGGAIALGHPLGCSGARILTTLVHEMKRREARLGLATMCIGVGQGISLIVERAT
jgi:3-oxoadipyl-CoA thiolase